jgi:hypothetical protein
VSTVSGSRPLNGSRNFATLTGLPKSEYISSPFPFVEIRGQKRTGMIEDWLALKLSNISLTQICFTR